jgi:hypothetical protein
MAVSGGGDIAQRIVRALQEMRRGEADGVEIRGSVFDEEVARTVVADFLKGFELDVIFTELTDGFLVAVRNPPSRTIQIDL